VEAFEITVGFTCRSCDVVVADEPSCHDELIRTLL
jgi:hypothetical protein